MIEIVQGFHLVLLDLTSPTKLKFVSSFRFYLKLSIQGDPFSAPVKGANIHLVLFIGFEFSLSYFQCRMCKPDWPRGLIVITRPMSFILFS